MQEGAEGIAFQIFSKSGKQEYSKNNVRIGKMFGLDKGLIFYGNYSDRIVVHTKDIFIFISHF